MVCTGRKISYDLKRDFSLGRVKDILAKEKKVCFCVCVCGGGGGGHWEWIVVMTQQEGRAICTLYLPSSIVDSLIECFVIVLKSANI